MNHYFIVVNLVQKVTFTRRMHSVPLSHDPVLIGLDLATTTTSSTIRYSILGAKTILISQIIMHNAVIILPDSSIV
jgi:hypothetical protein